MPEWINNLTIGEIIGWMVGTTATVAVVWKAAKPIVRFVQGIATFLHDWNGEPERRDAAGNLVEPGRPGVVAQIATVRAEVNLVKQQVQNSHVTNLRDDVDEVIGKVSRIDDQLRVLAEHHGAPVPPTE